MKKPEMIIFDYGHTLLYEPGFDVLRGERAAFSYIVENPRHLTAEQVSTAVQELFGELQGLRESDIEIFGDQILHFLSRVGRGYMGCHFTGGRDAGGGQNAGLPCKRKNPHGGHQQYRMVGECPEKPYEQASSG